MIRSLARAVGHHVLPTYTSDKKLQMLPIKINRPVSLPENFEAYYETLKYLLYLTPKKAGHNGYAFLTIDEKRIPAGQSHRRGGPHIDGNYVLGGIGAWEPPTPQWQPPKPLWKPPTPQWNQSEVTGGMLIISNYPTCKGWIGNFEAEPGEGGDLSHISDTLDKREAFILKANTVYLSNSTFIHESLPVEKSTYRTLVRLTLDEKLKVF